MTAGASYHGQPVIKAPVWTWQIPWYFFTGGVAGASAGLGYLCELRGDDALARRAWAAAMAGICVSPALLIADLGRPQRFLNMLRMFKVTSPMSVGTWILQGSAASTAIAAAHAWFGLFPRLARVAAPAAALLGLPLSTYTAALVTNTAVPVWHEARRTLPFVFGAGAGLSAGAAALIGADPATAAPARRLALGGAAMELATTTLMHRGLGEHGRPYSQGRCKHFDQAASGFLAVGSALLAARGSRSRTAAAAGGVLLLAGAVSTRWSVFAAGRQSAADPHAVIDPQRAGIARGERIGGARTEPVARDAAAPAGPAS
ncbi:MAG: polysulfide reductase NrfD [Solirubrobacterales bacterium]|nr:polysulfide reductase NrfD [Solirubrobacterales bacterium]